MDHFERQYDNLFPLHPQYLQYDSANDINPSLHSQNIAPFDAPMPRSAAPRGQISQDDMITYPTRMSRISTFTLEKMVYNMSKQVNYLFYIHILTLILIIIVVSCSVISVLGIGIRTNRA
jgi:hypothetical protein